MHILKSSPELGNQYLDRLLSVVSEYLGAEELQKFNSEREQRNQYLQDRWSPAADEQSRYLFREVDYEHLITSLQNALTPDPKRLNDALLKIVDICLQFGQYNKSKTLLNTINSREKSENNPGLARIYMMYGYLEGQMNQLASSKGYLLKALKIFENLNNKNGMAFVYNSLGILAAEQWDTESGYRYFTQAEKLKAYVDTQLMENVVMNLGVILGIRGELQSALSTFDTLLNSVDPSDTLTRTNILINKGIALKDSCEYSTAEAILKKALALANAIPNQRLSGLANLGLAETYAKSGRAEKGLEKVVKAFKIFSQLHDRTSLADTYRVFGIIYRDRGYYKLAESQFEISINLNKEVGNLQNLAETYTEFSITMQDQRKYDAQKEYLEKALEYYKKMRAPKRYEKVRARFNTSD